MKVKFITDKDVVSLERRVNMFINSVDDVIDIKFSFSDNVPCVMIIYKKEHK